MNLAGAQTNKTTGIDTGKYAVTETGISKIVSVGIDTDQGTVTIAGSKCWLGDRLANQVKCLG